MNDSEWGWIVKNADEAKLGKKGWDSAWEEFLNGLKDPKSCTIDTFRSRLDELMQEKRFKRIFERGVPAFCSYDVRKNDPAMKAIFQEYEQMLDKLDDKAKLIEEPHANRRAFRELLKSAPHLIFALGILGSSTSIYGFTESLTEDGCKAYWQTLALDPCSRRLTEPVGLASICATQLAEYMGNQGVNYHIIEEVLINRARAACRVHKLSQQCCKGGGEK